MKTHQSTILTAAIMALLALNACTRAKQEEPKVVTPAINLLDRGDAAQFLLDRLDLGGTEPLEVRMLDRMLNAGDYIEEIDGDYRHTANDYQWFALVDRAPGALLSRPLEYAYLDYRTESVHVTERREFPMLNGKPIYPSYASYRNDRNLIFSRTQSSEGDDRPSFAANHSLIGAANLLNAVNSVPVPRMAKDENPAPKRRFALLMSNYDLGPVGEEITANLRNMADAMEANGYEVMRFIKDPRAPEEVEPYLDLMQARNRGLFQLRNFVRRHNDKNDACEEMLVYFTGKTDVEESVLGPRPYIPIGDYYAGEDNKRQPSKRFYAEDLADILKDLASCHINIVVDANYSGGFIEPLLKLRKVETVIASCAAAEYAYTSYYDWAAEGTPDPYGRDQGERGSEFTSGFAKGLVESAGVGSEELPAYRIATIGYKSALTNDVSFIAGKTHPTLAVRDKDSGCRYGIDD